MIYKNEETDAVNLFESFVSGIIFDDHGTYLTILIDWIDGSGDAQTERISFTGKYCVNFQCDVQPFEYYKKALCIGFEITGFSYKKIDYGYLVQFDFNVSTKGYLRFECEEFSIEAVGEPLQPGGNDNFHSEEDTL